MEFVAGFLIALAIGVTGVGAGSITAPILILFFHQTASNAVTAALIFGIAVKVIATPIYMARGQVNFRVLKYVALGGLPAVIAGSLLLNAFDKNSLSRPILIVVGITVVISAAGTFWRSLSPAGVASRPVAVKWLPWIVAPIGFEVGFSSAGAGALGTVALMRFTDLQASEVVGTDLAFGLLLSIFAGGIHAGMTGIPWAILTKLLIGGVPGVLIGTQLTSVLSPRRMRLALCVWLIYIGGQLSWKALGPADRVPAPKAAAVPAVASAPARM
ncbi:MAG: sulfite exporter TauE/SafE family protein [Acidobacteriota bacterium]|nr:sulfite exporter TauE/SafE family protein [Acidobacteriota bacterium]